MSKFEIRFGDNEPFIAGLDQANDFYVTIYDGISVGAVESPRIIVNRIGGKEGEDISVDTWLEEEILATTPISIRLVDGGEIATPAKSDTTHWPKLSCSFCNKTSDDVEYLVEAPSKISAICNDCVEICAGEIAKRRDEKADG